MNPKSLETTSAWPPVLTPESFAELLGFPSPDAARKFIKRHEIPATPIGKRLFIRTSQFLSFLAEHEKSAPRVEISRPVLRRSGSPADALRRAGNKHKQRRARAKGVAEGP